MKDHLKAIITTDEIKDLSIDLAEQVIDENLSESALKEIPILKTIISIKKAYNSISDSIFLKKAMCVLYEMKDVSTEDRVKFIQELEDKHDTGVEKILMIIDKIESTEKAKIIGRLIKIKATTDLSIKEFNKLIKLIKDAHLEDLILIEDFQKGEEREIWEGDYYSLISLGLIHQEVSEQTEIRKNRNPTYDGEPEYVGGKIEIKYTLSDLGYSLKAIYQKIME